MTKLSKAVMTNEAISELLDLCEVISMDLLIAETQSNIFSNEEMLETHSIETIQTAIYGLNRDLGLIREKFEEVHKAVMINLNAGRG